MIPSGRVRQPIVLLAMLTLYVLAISGCNSKPTDPAPKEATDYIAYFADLNSDNYVYGYHILSGQLDSFQVPALPVQRSPHQGLPEPRMVVSADGDVLYLALKDSVLEVQIADPTLVTVLPYRAELGVSVSPDGSYLAILNSEGPNILTTSDHLVLFQDTVRVFHGQFSNDSKVFFGSERPTNAYRVDIGQAQVIDNRVCSDWYLVQVIPAIDGALWYVLTADGHCTSAIEVYDSDGSGSTLQRNTHGGGGEIEVTPDGRYVVYTHSPSVMDFCNPRPASLSRYDVLANSVQTVDIVLDPDDTAGGIQDYPYLNMRDVEITPDGRWIVTTSGGLLAVVDASTFEVRNYIHQHGRSIHYLTIQNSL